MSVNVSNYPQDFQAADPAVLEPVDSTLFLGVHPLLLLLLAALVLGLMVLAWRAGKGATTTQPDAAESIWRAIDRACQAAMTANSDALVGAAKALRVTYDDCLGAVVILAEGPSKPLKAVDHALKGRIKEPVKAKEETPSQDPTAKPDRPGPHHAAVPASVTVVSNSHVVIKGDRVEHAPDGSGTAHAPGAAVLDKPPYAPHPPKPVPPPAPANPVEKEVEREMTKAEQLSALREAVAQFNDHWCRRKERIDELRAAHRQLSTPRGGHASGHSVGPRH
ncbi:hypothetical protein GCM10017620_04290 [Brevundimonas intermedia]|uniref:Uncharacterized protein n=1 Tax=Brevundimonas intermedia TaxID=74315 RepID=A0ABQ5T6Q2_9CAUL|nr:hypothetical protein [Brevundimonas intermedia]GLK47456.1 hypothetical protein GCM10017620_04290 [Brevundimonas intermedia]